MNQTDSFKNKKNNQKGVSLITAIVLMMLLGVSATIGVALITSANFRVIHQVQSLQALGIAQAGIDWYLEQLEDDTNWDNQTNDSRSFGPSGTTSSFQIQVTSAQLTEVTFNSLGLMTGTDGRVMQRRITVTAKKISPAFLFAVYQGSDPGANLQLRNGSTITGDMWSRGSVEVLSGNTVQNGLVYVPDNETVTGAGTFTSKLMATPYLTMPVITTTSYTTLMNSYDTTIATASGASNVNQSTNLVLTGNTILARDFVTSGSITITGNGTIVAFRNLRLHDGVGGALTVTPSGGDIVFLAGRDLVMGDADQNPNVTLNQSVTPGDGICRLYSEAQTNNNQRVNIRGPNSVAHNANIYARRRITVASGATVDQGSLLYIDRAPSTNNNQINIADTNTTVAGSVISTGQDTANLRCRNGAAITGLVYSYDSGGNGRLELTNCTVTGAVVADRFRVGGQNNRIVNSTITYSATSLPSTIPDGFENFAMVDPNSWDAL